MEEAKLQDPGVSGTDHRLAAGLAWSLCAISLVLTALGLWLLNLNLDYPGIPVYEPWLGNTLGAFSYAPVGALIAAPRPANPVGWLVSLYGFVIALSYFCAEYAIYALLAEPGSLRRWRSDGLDHLLVAAHHRPYGVAWFEQAGFVFNVVFVPAVPVYVGIAILRYRLYDIDVIINRTLVYGTLTATLLAIYFGGVATSQAILRALTGHEQLPQLAVVVSTLAIAARFKPIRRRPWHLERGVGRGSQGDHAARARLIMATIWHRIRGSAGTTVAMKSGTLTKRTRSRWDEHARF